MDGPKISVRGTVTNSKGERIGGATLVLRAKIQGQFYSRGMNHNREILPA